MALCPRDCANRDSIPFLSTAKKLLVRATVFEDPLVIVEDYEREESVGAGGEPEATVLRQLLFAAYPVIVQSEVPLVYRSTKGKKTQMASSERVESELCPV